MKLKSYKEVLKMCKEKLDENLAGPRAHRAKKQAELELAKSEEALSSLEAKVHELCSEKELDFGKVIDAMNKVDLETRKAKQIGQLISELFP